MGDHKKIFFMEIYGLINTQIDKWRIVCEFFQVDKWGNKEFSHSIQQRIKGNVSDSWCFLLHMVLC